MAIIKSMVSKKHAPPPYNPYDLIEIHINGQLVHARRIQFDSDIVDKKESKNAFGCFVKPNRISATCPNCGSGLILDVILSDPPFGDLYIDCEYCNPKTQEPDKFVITNDVVATQEETDPLLCSGSIISDTLLSDRIASNVNSSLSDILDEVQEGPLDGLEEDFDDGPVSEEFLDSDAEESEEESEEDIDSFDDDDLIEPE